MEINELTVQNISITKRNNDWNTKAISLAVKAADKLIVEKIELPSVNITNERKSNNLKIKNSISEWNKIALKKAYK